MKLKTRRNKMSTLSFFYCYNKKLMIFLSKHKVKYICTGKHVRTSDQFWQYQITEELQRLLEQWKTLKWVMNGFPQIIIFNNETINEFSQNVIFSNETIPCVSRDLAFLLPQNAFFREKNDKNFPKTINFSNADSQKSLKKRRF